jgi:glucosamine--fructose-6-phosphate aminotransferase (isomerizing)
MLTYLKNISMSRTFPHAMLQEIYEQPDMLADTIARYAPKGVLSAEAFPGIAELLRGRQRLVIAASGSSRNAGLAGEIMLEDYAGLAVDVEYASEYSYRSTYTLHDPGVLVISQSGETADTLAALRWCKARGIATAALVNVHESTMAREADVMLPTNAGPEIGVASTKAFTAQVAALTALAIAAARQRGRIDAAEEARLAALLLETPRLIAESLVVEDAVRVVALEIARARDVLYLGRGPMFPLALEGALKLKEISYIHAEGYAAGELKHGPIALVDEATPIIVIAPTDELFEKTMSNMSEVLARGGRIVLITDPAGAAHAPPGAQVIIGPACDPVIAPLVFAGPIQLLAYHVAVQKGADVDQPRNLAKSVTVE